MWSDAILLNQDQSATVSALVVSYVGMNVTIIVDQPLIQITSHWDGSVFQTDFIGEEHIAGYAVSAGDNETRYLLNYVADVGALSTVTIDAQVKEASVTASEA